MIDFSTITGVTLGSSEVTKIEDALGTILWQKIVYYNVSISAGANGTVTVNGNPGPFSGSVASGTTLTIEGTGSTGYEFDEWSDGNTSNPRTITVTSDLTLTAAFEIIQPALEPFYIEDKSGSNNTLNIYGGANTPDIEVFSSTDKITWTSMGTTSSQITATVPANGKLYLKATANQWGTTVNDTIYHNRMNCLGNYAIGGNIMSLLSGDNYQNATLDTNYTHQLCGLFDEISTSYRTLIDASNLVLPANATEYCYAYMFQNCLNLTAAPALPATTLAADCYRLMFVTCTSLTTAPALPATTLANRCYYQMFEGCTALTSAPTTLPATNTASYCCFRMFAGCSALTTAPTLHATTLAANCYRQMFDGCSSLNSVTTYANTKDNLNPPLSNWLNGVSATGDFYNLGQLTYTADSASGIPSGWTEHHSLPVPCNVSISAGSNGSISVNGVPGNYSATVMSDTQLTLVATPAAGYQFDSWSDGDTNATRTITVTGDLTLTASFAQAVPNYFYVEDLSGQPNTLSILKSKASAPTIEVFSSTDGTNWSPMGSTNYYNAITDTIPANGKLYLKATANQWGTSATNDNNITADGIHRVGGNIMSLLYGDNFENTTLDTNYTRQFNRLFLDNTNLMDASNLELPSNTSNYCYYRMFYNCTALTTAPSLPATTLANYCYDNMFRGCTALTTAPATLPATTLIDYCYRSMFNGCTSLTTAPALPATTLVASCYYGMFNGCTSLNRVTSYADDISATSCLTNWLSGVSVTGDFYNLGSATYSSGASGIPSGWTEHTSL